MTRFPILSQKTVIIILLTGGLLTGAILGMIILIAGDIIGSSDYGSAARTQLQPGGPSSGKPAPEFTINSPSGSVIDFSEFSGKPLVINFWATWCGPCRLEMPYLEARYRTYEDQLNIIAVNSGESEHVVIEFVKDLDLTFTIGMDKSGEVQKDYLVIGLPRTFFVDKDGIILAQHIGSMSEKQLDEYLRLLGIPND